MLMLAFRLSLGLQEEMTSLSVAGGSGWAAGGEGTIKVLGPLLELVESLSSPLYAATFQEYVPAAS